MGNFINIQVNEFKLGELPKYLKSLFDAMKSFLYGIPRWLRYLLIATITVGGIYMAYVKFTTTMDINTLQHEVVELNKAYSSSVAIDDYRNDIHNLCAAMSAVEDEMTSLNDEYDSFLELFEEFVRKNHSNDPILNDINRLRKHNEIVRKSYHSYFERFLQIYADSTLNVKQSKQFPHPDNDTKK